MHVVVSIVAFALACMCFYMLHGKSYATLLIGLNSIFYAFMSYQLTHQREYRVLLFISYFQEIKFNALILIVEVFWIGYLFVHIFRPD